MGVDRLIAHVEGLPREGGGANPEAKVLSVAAGMVGAVSLARATTDRQRSDLLHASRTAPKTRADLPGA